MGHVSEDRPGRRASRWSRVLITGASSGLGKAFAEELPSSADLLLTGRNEEALQALREALAQPGRLVEVVTADLATDRGRKAVIRGAEDFGIDLLINNAGRGRLGSFLENPATEEKATVEVNIVAPVVLSHALLPGMLERARARHGRAGLINVASSAAYVPVPFMASYAASKAFDLCWTEALIEELRNEPIDVLALCPGAIRTAFGERAGYEAGHLPGAVEPRRVAQQALRAIGRRSVLMTNTAEDLAFGPIALTRHVVTGGLGLALRGLARRGRSG